MLPHLQTNETRVLAPGAHFGQVKSLHKAGSLIVAESYYEPFFQTPFHWHETASFTLVLGGSYVEEFRSERFQCEFGSALYRPAGEIHRDRMSKAGAYCLMVEMPNEWLQRITAPNLAFCRPRCGRNRGDFAVRIRRELALADELSPVVLEALVVELACEARRDSFREKHSPLWLRRLRERIDCEFASLPGLAAMARDAGVHVGHMARAFRQYFGCTIGEYARSRKIEYCCEKLRSESRSLCDLAASAGFSSQAHMTRLFKSQTGMTPGEFRRLKPRGCSASVKKRRG